jgi:hypothetical protein
MKTLSRILYVKKASLLILVILFTVVYTARSNVGATNNSSTSDLINDVTALKLGLGGYTIGTILTEDQVTFAKNNLEENAYEGTYKFRANDIFVVADDSSNMILAIYQRQEKIDRDQMKLVISMLMTEFHEPTTMAHDKLVYWAYSKDGKISDATYLDAKHTGKLDVIATVKLNSTVGIFPDKTTGSPEESSESKVEEQPLADIYILISSPPLLEGFLKQKE